MKNFERVSKPFERLMKTFELRTAKQAVLTADEKVLVFVRTGVSEPFERLTCLVVCKFTDLRQDTAINNKRDSMSRDFFCANI